ncbi:hypothetical protein LEP1GSC013_4333 [Leptospira interrogans serovar Valbuzzi str. Duyster]|nr:hypothetical protein LEP1GSC013_4333 [Leptospira interrogans serovar Valbuzzi str. Duyster]ENO70229.1 hypothetical protein LEP1GSC012_4040 [Leptospira interrogans serovar Valbuzzi str. Valbuzzi]
MQTQRNFKRFRKLDRSFPDYPLKVNPIEFWEEFIQTELLKIHLQRNNLLRNSKNVPPMNVN